MNKTILAMVILVMAAFTGCIVVGEDADAEVTPASITYSMGEGRDSTTKVIGDATVITIASPIELGFVGAEDFLHWTNASGAVFKAGQQYLISALGATENVMLTAVYDENIYVTLVIGDESFKCIVKDDRIDTTSDAYKAADAALKAIDSAKFRTAGFFAKDATVATDITGEFTESTTLTQKVIPYFKVVFVVEGTNISTVDSDRIVCNDEGRNIPNAPFKDNFTFAGWFDAEGKEVISYSLDKDEYTYAAGEGFQFTMDTILSAKFIPANMTVTFVVGEFTSTQTVLYGEKAMKPELPVGYISWVGADGVDFDFNTPVTENITLTAKAGEPATIYTITFEIDGKAPVVQKSDSMVLPDTAREGYAFQGWVVKGASQYVDPLAYEITGDITFVAVYKEVAPPEPEQPKFYQTPMGQCAIILAVFVVGLVFYGIFTGRVDVPKFKISRVDKDDEAVVEQPQEETKP